ncbi:MAG: hypothetical protein ACI4JB_10085, partial [Porcipelethomonas sp.]
MKKEIESGFFDSVDGDRKYTAEEMTVYYGMLYGSGIACVEGNIFGNKFALIPSGNTITQYGGLAYIEGRWYSQTIGLQYALSAEDKYYTSALKYDPDQREIVCEIIPGTADAPPEVKNENGVVYLKLYDKLLKDNTAGIVKDYRGTAECPYIKPLSEKVDKVEGKGLSANDFTDSMKEILEAVPENLADKADIGHNHDGVYLGINDTAVNSEKWDGLINDINTLNSADTWLLVV